MKFGKLENIEGVNFTLPQDHQYNPTTKRNDSPSNFYIGCTSWTTKEWKGKVYSAQTKAADFLVAYGRQFNTIELNTTHYRIPKREHIQKWVDQTPADFKFCPKVLQLISHSRDLGLGTNRLKDFCDAISLFEDKLGICFIQLPPYFDIDRLPILESFLKAFPQEIPLAVELRNESFYSSNDNLDKTVELLRNYNKTFVITDVAGRRDIVHMALTTTSTMIRFVGNSLHETDYNRIDDWVMKLNSWEEKGLKTTYFFPHEPDNILAPEISQYLNKRIQKNDNFKVRGPQLIDKQKTLF